MVIGKVNVPGGSSGLMLPANSVSLGSNFELLRNSSRTANASSVLAAAEALVRLMARKVTVILETSLVLAEADFATGAVAAASAAGTAGAGAAAAVSAAGGGGGAPGGAPGGRIP